MTEKQKTCLGFYEKDAQERETCHGIDGLQRNSTYYFDIKQDETFPAVPVDKFTTQISDQIRKTAATSIQFLHKLNAIRPENDEFRRAMAVS